VTRNEEDFICVSSELTSPEPRLVAEVFAMDKELTAETESAGTQSVGNCVSPADGDMTKVCDEPTVTSDGGSTADSGLVGAGMVDSADSAVTNDSELRDILLRQSITQTLHRSVCPPMLLTPDSSSNCSIVAARYRLTTYGRRAFSVAGPAAWNNVPVAFRDPTISDACFRRHLKTVLFTQQPRLHSV